MLLLLPPHLLLFIILLLLLLLLLLLQLQLAHKLIRPRFFELFLEFKIRILVWRDKSHTSHVTHHTSHVTRHTSHVTRHTSDVKRQQQPATTSSPS